MVSIQSLYMLCRIDPYLRIPLVKLYNLHYYKHITIITIILALYLFLTLIVVVKITNIFEGEERNWALHLATVLSFLLEMT
jgi:hypothetical protein